jgi:hypothetical protein
MGKMIEQDEELVLVLILLLSSSSFWAVIEFDAQL